MTDQCMHCELKGDIKKCLAIECFQHENWYAKKQQSRIDALEKKLWQSYYDSAHIHRTSHKKAAEYADNEMSKG